MTHSIQNMHCRHHTNPSRLTACLCVSSILVFACLFFGCSKASDQIPSARTGETVPPEDTTPADSAIEREKKPADERLAKGASRERLAEAEKKNANKKERAAKGSVAASRAMAPERSDSAKEKIDRNIKKKYWVSQKQSFTLVALNNGKSFAARNIKELNGAYTMQAASNPKRTVFETKHLKKSEITSMEPERGDEALWLKLKQARPPADAMDGYVHGRMIDLVFNRFLSEHPDSKYAEKVSAIRELWVDEKAKLDDSWIRAKGKWYSPSDMMPKFLPKTTRQDIENVKTLIANGRYLEAAILLGNVEIPSAPDFNTDRKAVRRMRDQILEYIGDTESEYQRHAKNEKAEARSKHQRQRTKIDHWKPKYKGLVWNKRTESAKQYRHRKRRMRVQADADLRARQKIARQKVDSEYEEALKKIDHKFEKRIEEAQRARDVLKELRH